MMALGEPHTVGRKTKQASKANPKTERKGGRSLREMNFPRGNQHVFPKTNIYPSELISTPDMN
jgi:hypothetical protein